MRRREVVFAPEARDDVFALFDWIAAGAGAGVARNYIERRYCLSFDLASERGIPRDDIRKGLRVLGFERRLAIAFTVGDDRVTILRVFRAGRNRQSLMG